MLSLRHMIMLAAVLTVSGCEATKTYEFIPPPGGTRAIFDRDMAVCRLAAMQNLPQTLAPGNPLYGLGVLTALNAQADYVANCMRAAGYEIREP